MKYIKLYEEINFDEWDEEETNNNIDINNNDNNDNIIDWPFEINNEDVRRYEGMIEDLINEDDIEIRMTICDTILMSLQMEYEHLYDNLEDDIRDLIFY